MGRLLFTLLLFAPGVVLGLLTGGRDWLPLVPTKVSSPPTTTITASPPRVQRHYQKWIWKTARYGGREFEINYRVEGPVDGTPILLTHGFGANANHFRFQFPALVKAGYRVYAMDLLGFGASEKPSDVPYSIDLFAQQMTDFLQEHTAQQQQEQKSWILSGNSMGGLCSLAVAAQQEKSFRPLFDISAIILFNSAGGMSGFRYKDVPAWAHPIMGHLQYFLLNPNFHGPFLFQTLVRRPVIESVLKQGGIYNSDSPNVDEDLFDILLQPATDDGAVDVFLNIFAGPAGPTRESLVSQIKTPIYALWGSDDGFTPLDDAVHALGKMHAGNDWTLDVLPGAGHCLHDDSPELVNTKVLNFLESRGLTTVG